MRRISWLAENRLASEYVARCMQLAILYWKLLYVSSYCDYSVIIKVDSEEAAAFSESSRQIVTSVTSLKAVAMSFEAVRV